MRLSALRMVGVALYEVRRSHGGDYGSGKYVPGPTTTVTVYGRAQPLSGRELLHFEQGDRLRERKKFYCYDELFTVDDSKGKLADVITMDGKEFVVEKVDAWSGYWKAILVRKNEPG